MFSPISPSRTSAFAEIRGGREYDDADEPDDDGRALELVHHIYLGALVCEDHESAVVLFLGAELVVVRHSRADVPAEYFVYVLLRHVIRHFVVVLDACELALADWAHSTASIFSHDDEEVDRPERTWNGVVVIAVVSAPHRLTRHGDCGRRGCGD